MSNLLFDDPPLVINPALAVAIGLNEAIVLQQLHYWLKKSKHVHDGRTWIYNTYDQWQEQFPFWSYNTVRRTLKKLEGAGLTIVGNYNKKAYDKTKWYTIDYDRLPKMGSGIETVTAQNGQINESKVGRPVPETTRDYPKTDAEASGASYACPDCGLICKSKGGLTRHRHAKHDIDTRNPAVAIYQDITHYTPVRAVRETIEAQVTDFIFWQEVVLKYVLTGWNPRNAANMLVYYGNREIPSTNGGGNGNGKIYGNGTDGLRGNSRRRSAQPRAQTSAGATESQRAWRRRMAEGAHAARAATD